MAVIAVPNRSSVSVFLNAGTNPSTGGMLSKSVSLSGVKPSADNEKIINVTDLLANVLIYPIVRVSKTVVTDLEKQS